MKSILITLFVLLSFSAFSQSQISTSQIKDGAVTAPKLASNALRPVDGGTLSDYELVFGPDYRKKYNLAVTSDIALTLSGSTQTADSYIFISTIPDGTHVISFPSDWIKKTVVSFDPNKTQRIELYYDGSKVYIDIFNADDIVLSTLTSAVMDEGTDDLTLAFSNPVSISTLGWTVTASGGAATVSSVVSGSGTNTIVFDLSRNITSGEDMTISYNPATGATVSSTGNEIAVISAFTVDTGEGAIPDNSITVDDSGGKDYTTGTAASNAATAGQTVVFYSGTYRETIPGKAGVTYQAAPGETPIISGSNQVTDSWTAHDLTGGKSIYKAVITGGLPVDNTAGYNLTISGSNTTLFNNQIFKDGAMMFEARYPNIDAESDLLEFTGNQRHYSQANMTSATQIVDTGIPATGLTGAKIVIQGWFRTFPRIVATQPTQTTITWSGAINNHEGLNKYRHWYYICGKLPLLDAAKEWYYDPSNNTLYLWQTGGGSPTGVEYKARNWGFDLRGIDDVTIKGLTFIGCEVAEGNTSTDRVTIDNIRATYTNHDVMYEDVFPGYGNATETGTKLLGVDNTFENSESRYGAAHGVWLGTGGLFKNNWFRDYAYDGSWGAAVSFAGNYTTVTGAPVSTMAMWGDADNVRILNNTIERMGRSCVDMGFSYTPEGVHDNLNIEVGYNKFTKWGMINVDVGAIYSWGFRNLTGSVYHHNEFFDDGVLEDPTGAALHGGQYAAYQDQASGPVTHHHNIYYNNWTNLPTNAGDTYNQSNFEHRNAGSSRYYNNTYASTAAPYSHKLSVNAPEDIWRNNIFVQRINNNWGNAGAPDEQYNLFDGEITGTTTSSPGTGTVKNHDFSGTNVFAGGSGSLAYIPSVGSLARNSGVVIPGITDDDDGTPDKGARRYGDPDPWVAGYNAAAVDNDFYIEDNNLAFTAYKVAAGTPFSPTVQSNPAGFNYYHGGTSSFFNTDEAYVEITLPSAATGFEWYAEKFNISAIVEVQVDGVRQDCDAGTGGTQDCDLYLNTTTKNSTLIFTKTGMSTGAQKVIKLINKSANGSSGGQFLTHDAIKYEQ